jgi:hypothetical protein
MFRTCARKTVAGTRQLRQHCVPARRHHSSATPPLSSSLVTIVASTSLVLVAALCWNSSPASAAALDTRFEADAAAATRKQRQIQLQRALDAANTAADNNAAAAIGAYEQALRLGDALAGDKDKDKNNDDVAAAAETLAILQKLCALYQQRRDNETTLTAAQYKSEERALLRVLAAVKRQQRKGEPPPTALLAPLHQLGRVYTDMGTTTHTHAHGEANNVNKLFREAESVLLRCVDLLTEVSPPQTATERHAILLADIGALRRAVGDVVTARLWTLQSLQIVEHLRNTVIDAFVTLSPLDVRIEGQRGHAFPDVVAAAAQLDARATALDRQVGSFTTLSRFLSINH